MKVGLSFDFVLFYRVLDCYIVFVVSDLLFVSWVMFVLVGGWERGFRMG